MAATVLLCTDGSELANEALRAGSGIVDPGLERVLVTVIADRDETLVVGTGMASGTMSAEEFDAYEESLRLDADAALSGAAAALGLDGADRRVVRGSAGRAICTLAEELGAAAIVVGSRGHGGLRRAVLGSVADHIVRNAPCPVLVAGKNT